MIVVKARTMRYVTFSLDMKDNLYMIVVKARTMRHKARGKLVPLETALFPDETQRYHWNLPLCTNIILTENKPPMNNLSATFGKD